MADHQIVLAVLVPKDVAAPLCSFGQVVNQTLLLKAELLEGRYFIAQYLDIGKAVNAPIICLGDLLFACAACARQNCGCHHDS